MHQKTPVSLLKYCHNKDLNEIGLRISVKKSKSATRMADKSAKKEADKIGFVLHNLVVHSSSRPAPAGKHTDGG